MQIFGITFSTTDIWLFSAIGALFILFLSIKSADETRKRDIFNNAAKELTDTFHRELKEVYPIPANWPNKIDPYLRERFDNLSAAVGKFKGNLPKRKQRLIEEAWFRFYCCTGRENDRNCQCYHHYMPFKGEGYENGKPVSHDNTKTYKEDFKKNVDSILEFATPK